MRRRCSCDGQAVRPEAPGASGSKCRPLTTPWGPFLGQAWLWASRAPPQGWGPGEQLWGVGRAPSQGPELCGPRPVAGGPFPHLSVPFQLPALGLADFRWFRSGHAPISQRHLCEPAGQVGGGFSPSHLPWSQWPREAPWGVPGCSPPCRARCGHLDPSRCPDSRSLTPRSASPGRGR